MFSRDAEADSIMRDATLFRLPFELVSSHAGFSTADDILSDWT